MPVTIAAERPDTPDATALINELQTHLESFYPPESRHGFSVDKLIAQGVAFFVLRVDGRAAGCGGIMLVGQEYGELLIEHLAAHAKSNSITLLRLETGIHQRAAIRLYEQYGFRRIPPFAPYFEDPVSRCYEMSLA